MSLRNRAAATAVIAVLCAITVGCSSGGAKPGKGTFAVPSTSPGGKATGGATVPAGKLKAPPPARMFAGTQSVLGQLTRYCKSEQCVVDSPHSPKLYLPAPTGAFVVFSLGETPVEARAEVRATPGEQPGIVTLTPNTLMVFDFGLGKGAYLVDLFVRWRGSEARWRFGLNVTS